MARKLRLEYDGALYHVISRGNYRADIFASDGAKDAFLDCLWEACERADWRVQAYIVMRNHYHLALETPRANLVEGMRWLQATFANRFNRFRQEHGHVFQGRYRAIVVENLVTLGAVGHYIHLNPVRAGVLPVEQLAQYRHSSYAWLDRRARRPAALTFAAVLESAGRLTDNAAGWKVYREYLAWLSADEPAKQQLAFGTLAKGWALGSRDFKRDLIEEHKQALAETSLNEAETREVRELLWEARLQSCLRQLGKSARDIAVDRKAAAWKVAVAAQLKQHTGATNPWLADALQMGAPAGVSRYVGELKRGARPEAAKLKHKIAKIMV